MKKQLLTWCAALLSAGMLCAQDTVRTVQGIPHPNGQYAAPRQAASTKTRALAAPANGFTMDDIEYWIGEGSKRALFAVQWNDPRETHALVWGYNFDGDKYGVDLVRDIAAADPAFYAMIQFTGSMGFTICGLGYDRDGDGEIALRNKKTGEMLYPDEPGIFINTNGYDYDNYEVADADDYWGAGWYNSYWSYWVADGGGDFGYSGLGASSRKLSDGSWDGWNFALNMSTNSFKPFSPAPAPGYTNGTLFFHSDGNKTSLDYLNKKGEWEQNLYATLNNGENLPAQLASATIFGKKLYLLSPGTEGKLIAADAQKLIKQSEISIPNAMNFCGVSPQKGYISTAEGIYTIDLENLSLGNKIAKTDVENGISAMIASRGRVFALQPNGKVFVIDAETNEIKSHIYGNYSQLVQSGSGMLYATDGNQLVSIDPQTLYISEIILPEYAPIGKYLLADPKSDMLYYTCGSALDSCSIYRFDPNMPNSLESAYFSLPEETYDQPRFYGSALNLDCANGLLYIHARTADGRALRYKLEASTGKVLTEEVSDEGFYTTALLTPDIAPGISGLESALTFEVNDTERTFPLQGTFTDANQIDSNIEVRVQSEDPEIVEASLSDDQILSIAPQKDRSGSTNVVLTLCSNGVSVEKKIAITIHRALEGIRLVSDRISMTTGSKDTLSVEFFPADATVKDLTWSYKTYSIANVDSKGIVTARKAGDTEIYVKSKEGNFADTCYVSIADEPVSGLLLAKDTIRTFVNCTDTLKYQLLPANASNTGITWVVEDKSIINFTTYNQTLKGLKEGTTRIFAETKDGGFKDTCVVISTFNPATSFSLSEEEIWITAPGKKSINIQVLPADASNRNFSGYSLDPSVAEITSSNSSYIQVKGLKAGDTRIVVQSDDDPKLIALCEVHVSFVAVEGFSLSEKAKTVAKGKTFNISKSFIPESGISNDTVVWTSSDATIATVSKYGIYGQVKGISTGEALIVATTRDGGFSDTCRVTVVDSIPVEGIAFSDSLFTFKEKGSGKSIAAQLIPADATNTKVSYTVEDPSVVTCSQYGYINVKGPGTTRIIVRTEEGQFTDTCTIRVYPLPTDIRVAADTIQLIPGENAELTAEIFPAEAEQSYTWSSTDANCASIDEQGLITALKEGTSLLIAATENKLYDTCVVIVRNMLAERIELDANQAELQEGEALQLSATVYPSTTTDARVRWTTSDHAIATVSAYGYVKAHAEGRVVIRAISMDGSQCMDSCIVSVLHKAGVGIESADYESGRKAYIQGSNLVVEGCQGNTLYLTTSDGNLLKTMQPADEKVYYPVELPSGIYFITSKEKGENISIKLLVE